MGEIKNAAGFIHLKKQEVRLKEQQVLGVDRQITTLENSRAEILTQTSDVEKERDTLKKLSAKGLEIVGKKQELQKLIQLQQASLEILGDSGVKARIISEYLPILNQLINRYLQQLDMYISFFLDEEFKETVKSRYRDEFTYDSFSEGEKAKIDLALTLALADIAKMKNSLHTNLVFFDEVDANLDITAVDAYMNLIEARVGNVFAISHKPQLQDKFHSVIRIEKQGDYSVFSKN
jgi:DNA repair exonuclease SbcCD ATPase subunit